MSLSINQNIMAMNSYRNLSVTQGGLAKSLEKLSSGFRINRAADDAAGLAISEGLRSQVRGNRQAVRNTQDGISVIQTAEGALNEVHSILQRMRELAVQGANDSNSAPARDNVNTELNQLRDELERIGNVTNFNGTKLLDGTASGGNALKFQVGANGTINDRIVVDFKDADITKLSDFKTVVKESQVYKVETTAAAADGKTYRLDVGGKYIEFKGGADNYAVKKNFADALAKSGVSGHIKGITAEVTGDKKLEADTDKTLAGKYTLTIGSHKFEVTTEGGKNDAAEDIAQKLDAAVQASQDLHGKYKVSQNGGKFTVKAQDKTLKAVSVELVTDAAGAKEKNLIKDKTVGVNSGGDYEFDVANSKVSFTRTDGKAINVDNAHAFMELGADLTKNPATDKGLTAYGKDLTTVLDGNPGKELVKDNPIATALTVKDHESAQELIRVLDTKIQSVSTARANLGAIQNRFEHTITNLNVAVENLAASESRIRDTDMAQEMMQFTRNQILSQAGTSMLAQANQVPQGVLSLLR
ncbi:flagellin [Mobiluncus mulieris]|nr:flagellin [Mobiluncus mulieris]